jgi:CMP-N-acetylneuraminic acid synthetase
VKNVRSVAFIPARGGSKRLPGKNLRELGGKPLIYYSIKFAQFNAIDRVVVSTDCSKIAQTAMELGAEVVIRPTILSSDTSNTAEAARHCMETLNLLNLDVFVTLQPTNPLRPQQLYKDALKIYNDSSDCDSVISLTQNKNKLGNYNDCFIPSTYSTGTRGQDLKPLYYENGLIYLTKPYNVLKGEIFGQKIKAVITHELFALADIDEEFDFDLTELLYNKYIEYFKYLN